MSRICGSCRICMKLNCIFAPRVWVLKVWRWVALWVAIVWEYQNLVRAFWTWVAKVWTYTKYSRISLGMKSQKSGKSGSWHSLIHIHTFAAKLLRSISRISEYTSFQTQPLGATMQFRTIYGCCATTAELYVQTFRTQPLGATKQLGSKYGCGETHGATSCIDFSDSKSGRDKEFRAWLRMWYEF